MSLKIENPPIAALWYSGLIAVLWLSYTADGSMVPENVNITFFFKWSAYY